MRAAARIRDCAAVVVFATGIMLATTAATRAPVPGSPGPPALPALTATNLSAIYQRNHDYIAAAARAAARIDDTGRARVLAALAAPGRDFLSFSPVGEGQAVEVVGDLANADRIAVVVPGSDTTLDTYDFLGTRYTAVSGAARTLAAQMRRLDPGGTVAVVAWLGYAAPRSKSVDVLTMGRAEQGAVALGDFLARLRQLNGAARLSLVCHSYGSVVCATALPHLPTTVRSALSAVVVVGSPGLGVPDADALGTGVPLWAGRGTRDAIARVPHVQLHVLGVRVGFGADPTAPGFGALSLPVGDAAHTQYFKPGSQSLRAIATVALGETPTAVPGVG